MIEPGTLIDGRYEVLRRLGSGGMADVYLASDQLLGRQVAVKLLHHRFAEDQEFVERFKREASSAAGLSHPNVVSIFDRGEWDGTYYIAMEHLPGRTLKSIVREQGPLPPAAAIDVVLQMLRAARFAHRRGVIHRDLKPHNVILDEEGRAKVTDFGIARAGASDMTLTGSIMGTAQYLSPEQAQGQAVSEGSDLYAIGVVLYELLTGKVPFEGETAVTIALQHISREAPPPSTVNPAVPPALDAVVLRALRKDPAERFHSAEEAIAALEAVRSGEAAPSPTERAALPAAAVAGAVGLAAAQAGPPTQVIAAPENGGAWQPSTGQLAAYDPGSGPRGPAAGGPWPPDGEPPETGDSRRRWLWASAVVPVLIAAALIVLLASPTKVKVPRVVGKTSTAAVAQLHLLGLRAEETDAASSSVPAGHIVSQSPRQGRLVKPHATVAIVVSTGVGVATVPRVSGLAEQEAVKRLDEAGLRPSIKPRSSETVKSGTAISTSPPAGKSLPAGSRVWLYISSGPSQVRVPSVIGEQRAEAEEQLEEAGLTVGAVTERQHDGSAAGTVLAQTPQGGHRTAAGTSVRLVVVGPAHPQSVVVPSVIEDAREAALATLRAVGLKPEVVSQAVPNPSQVGFVVKQSPSAGSHVHKGAPVKVYIGAQQTTSTSSTTSTGSQTTSQTSTQSSSTSTAQGAGG